jgi:hypothetical protein
LQPTSQPGQTDSVESMFQTRDSKRNSRVVSAPVGQRSVTLADIQLSSGMSGKMPTSVDAPRLKKASSFVFVTSAVKRMHRVQWMQRFMFCTTCGPMGVRSMPG